jgi:hypothetical protein
MAHLKEETTPYPISIGFSGGLNLSAAEWSIADNESPRMLNWLYNPESLLPEVRPGTDCQTASAFGASIRALYVYEKTATTKYIIGASGAKIYYLSGAGLDAWTEIGAIASATVVPEFITFNSKLLIADGGTKIKTWDGTTYTDISGSPNASALTVIKNRVVANHAGEPDSVYMSKTNDETDWNTAGDALGFKAGYGDLLIVNGFAVFGDDLIISKKGDAGRKTYRLNTAATATSDWYIKQIPGNTAAQSERAIRTAFNNVFIVDDDGIRSLKGVTEYGDLQADQTGKNINSDFSSSPTCRFLKYVPYYNALWMTIGDRFFTCRMIGDVPAFTELYFNQGRIDSLCVDESTIYLGGSNGYLYKLNDNSDVDETAPDTTSGFASYLRSKRFNHGADDLTLLRTSARLTPLSSGTVYLYCKTNEGDTLIDTISMVAEGDFLYDATSYLYSYTDSLYDAGNEAQLEVNHNRIKSSTIQFELSGSSVRFGCDAILAETMVTRGTW